MPISRRDILVLRELAVSESLPNLEFEPEWCSVAELPSISVEADPNDAGNTEPIALVAIEAVAAPLATDLSDLETTSTSNLFAAKPTGPSTKLRSETKSPRLKKMPQPTSTNRVFTALRSRRVRIVSTVAGVLFVCGLVMLNWKSGTPGFEDDITEMDLAEFNSVSGLDEPRIGNGSEPQPLGVLSDAEPLTATDRFPQMVSSPRLPPLGLVTQTDHQTSREQAVRGLVPASATSVGSRGAMLTGQIEFETPPRLAETPERPFRSLGMR